MPNFFINVKEKGAKKAAGNIGALTGSMKRMIASAAVAGVAMETMRKAIVRSAQVEGISRGFDNLAKSTGFSANAFDNFKKATDGTIDNLTLMKKANSAMLLGITDSEDQMANMFDVAQRLGQSLGIDTVQSIDSLVTGLGRQSKLMLDNLGIMVDGGKANQDYAESIGKTVSQLTDQERKTAFINAAMTEANFLVGQLGSEQLTTKDRIAQMNTALLESLTAFGNLLTPLVIPFAEALGFVAEKASALMDIVSGVNHEFTGTASTLSGFNVWLKANAEDEDALAQKTASLNAEQKKLKDELAGLTSTGQTVIDTNKDYAMSIDLSNKAVGDNLILTHEATNLTTDWSQVILDNQLGISNFTETQAESTLATINDNTERAKAIQFLIDEAEKKKKLIEISQLEAEIKKSTTAQNLDATSKLMKASSAGFKEFAGGAKIAARLQQTAATVDAYRTINKIMADPNLPFPANVITATAIGAQAFANVMSISKQLGEFKFAATGMNEIVTQPTMIMAGEAGAEQVSITPLEGPNIEGPQGSSVTVNVSGNLLSSEYVEGELAEAISEAARRGTDFGVS